MVLNNGSCIVLLFLLVNIDIKLVCVSAFGEKKSRAALCFETVNRVRRDLRLEHVEELLAEHSTATSATSNDKEKSENKVAYFSGQEIIRYSNIYFNIDIFTIQFYLQLEGGQIDTVPLIKIYDHCAMSTAITSTSIGLQEMQPGKDLRIYFELLTESGNISKRLSSHINLEVHKWMHVAAVYDGASMHLYINHAKVNATYKLNGMFLSNKFHKCTSLEIGGDSKKHISFRGSIDEIRLWNIAKTHKDIFKNIRKIRDSNNDNNTWIFHESFSTNQKNSRYYGITGKIPEIQTRKIDYNLKDIKIKIPPCGKTICDNPEIIKNYQNIRNMLTTNKIINYRLIKLANDDGSNPIVKDDEIIKKDKEINRIYNKYNITLKLMIHEIRNTSLRNKTIVLRCYNHCLDESSTACKSGKDISKCDTGCHDSQIGNKVCNPECNRRFYLNKTANHKNWDGGDCCNPKYTNISETCYDIESPNRAFLRDTELKDIINLDNRYHLNIFPVKLKTNTLGKGTFPWVQEVFGKYGGTIINVESFLNEYPADIIHELGHNFGLWHVHKGVSEDRCDGECVEDKPSMTHGDLCSDTNPTPKNSICQDEVIDKSCGLYTKYKSTPYRNYMGYTSGSCVTHFTPQQKARMHCYIDHYYEEWQEGSVAPSPIPIPPRVMASSKDKVIVTWMPPIGSGKEFARRTCHRCDSNHGTLKQYASKASSPKDVVTSEPDYSPSRAVGPPDVLELCRADPYAWLRKVTCSEPNCYLEVSFEKVVIPTAIKIWVTYNSKDSIKDIKLIHTDGSSTSLGPATTQCDEPYTRPIKTTKPVSHVRIYVHVSPKIPVAIDAVLLISETQHRHCQRCDQLKLMYNVYRQPPFRNKKKFKRVKSLRFEDESIEPGVEYKYRVQSVSGDQLSQLSPPLLFKTSVGYCGNGIIDKELGEKCDDENLRNGDGCDIQCQKEETFNCKEEPSLCYRHERDGICEDFERKSAVHDCGFYTPSNFIDQWATSVVGLPGQSKPTCPESVIAGKPHSNVKCSSFYFSDGKAWQPCRKSIRKQQIKTYSIEATFEKDVIAAAVIIYLASDGLFHDSNQKLLQIELKDTENMYHNASEKQTFASCKTNPLSVHVFHDMTKPIFRTKAVRISFERKAAKIAISAIALRYQAAEYIKNNCNKGEIFDRKSGKCVSHKHEVLPCKNFAIKHANVKCSNGNSAEPCTVRCNNGYVPTRAFNVTCEYGEWKGNKGCKPIDCGKFSIQHGTVDCPSTTLGSICTFKCNDNAHLYGTNTEISCQANGRWDFENSHCYVNCPRPNHVLNSVLYTTDSLPNECAQKDKSTFSMGTRCRFVCRPGYRPIRSVSGSVSGGNTVNMLCDGEGTWHNDSYCEKITCPAMSMYNTYLFTCTDDNRYQSTCSTNCLRTKVKTFRSKCLQNGDWSSSFDVCDKNVKCPPPKTSSKIDTESCKNDVSGSICRPQCRLWKDRTIPDIIHKKAVSSRKDVALYCMPNKKWLPPIEELDCVKPCSNRMGDTFCDCENNRQHCGYDGGDCCKLQTRDVRFAPSGSVKCSCIDPVALRRIELDEKQNSSGSGEGDVQDDSEREEMGES